MLKKCMHIGTYEKTCSLCVQTWQEKFKIISMIDYKLLLINSIVISYILYLLIFVVDWKFCMK